MHSTVGILLPLLPAFSVGATPSRYPMPPALAPAPAEGLAAEVCLCEVGVAGGAPAGLHCLRHLQRCRQLHPALPRATVKAQAGFPAQIIFALRLGLQDLPQGRSSYDSGGHTRIGRRGLANIGRQNLPIWLPQNIAIPKGDFQEHEFLIHQFRVFLPGRPESHLPFAARWRMRRGHYEQKSIMYSTSIKSSETEHFTLFHCA